MTCVICKLRERRHGGNTCWECIHAVARNGSGTAKTWTSFDEVDRDPAKIAENKRISAERVKRARLQGRAT